MMNLNFKVDQDKFSTLAVRFSSRPSPVEGGKKICMFAFLWLCAALSRRTQAQAVLYVI